MRPPVREKNFEKVIVGDFIPGVIEDIEYDKEHTRIFQGQTSTYYGVRFIFRLEGYAHKHYSRWMTFSYGERANLYKKYISKLVEGATPDMDFDLDELKGMGVKTIWGEENDFQSIENIFPAISKIVPTQVDLGEAPEPGELEGQV